MGRSYDEPFTLYGLLAESIETDEARSFVEFTLREGARFSDGSPVTVEDVLWSIETLGTKGSPPLRRRLEEDRHRRSHRPAHGALHLQHRRPRMPLILGLRPILKKAQWEGKDFTVSSLEAPIGSGPYVVGSFETGPLHLLRQEPELVGGRCALQPRPAQFRRGALRLLRRWRRGVRGVQGRHITSYREGNAPPGPRTTTSPPCSRATWCCPKSRTSAPRASKGFVLNTSRASSPTGACARR
jgi:peptide/nickel transport system substrate-binding protein